MASPPRGRLADLVPQAALWALLSAIWAGNARAIAVKAHDRCLGPRGSTDQCQLSFVLPSVVAAYSLVLLILLWLQEGELLKDGAGAGGAAVPPGVQAVEPARSRPSRRRLVGDVDGPISDSHAVLLIFCLSMACVVTTIFGAVFQLAAEGEKRSPTWRLGYACIEGGCLGLSAALCIVIIPYMMIRLTRLHRKNGRRRCVLSTGRSSSSGM